MVLKILTINFWGIPILTYKINERREKLTNYLIKNQLDIIFLQEVWRNKDVKRLKKTLNNFYINKIPKYKRFLGFIKLNSNGGLVTISKFPIKKSKFYSFKNIGNKLDEKIGEKGFLVTDILFNNEKIKLINLHLAAGESEKDKKVRKDQIKQIVAYIKIHDLPFIVGGDFNIDSKSKEYRDVKKYFYNLDVSDCYTYDEIDNIIAKTIHRLINLCGLHIQKKSKIKIDHILIRKKDKTKLRFKKSKIIFTKENFVSDHYGYLLHLLVS